MVARKDLRSFSKIERRNSTIMVTSWHNKTCVRKQYHAKYSAEEERAAYKELARLLERKSGIRTPEVYDIDETQNIITIEYIRGPNLLEDFFENRTNQLSKKQDKLLSVFIDARKSMFAFDGDPTNIVWNIGPDEIVIIDPVCEQLGLRDYAMVVFLWGIIKGFFKCRRWHQLLTLRRTWLAYYRGYLINTGQQYSELNRQMAEYIARVIQWNLCESKTEARRKRFLRILLVVPLWFMIKLVFKWDLVKCNRSQS